jgi:Ankyrin repeats (3 copies)/Ankyrin repeat
VYEDKLVKILLEKKADPDIKRSDNKWSVLRRASYRGSDSLVQMLLKNGAKVNYTGKDFWTALHQACDEGEDKVVDILLREGADSTIRTRDTGEIPLHLAARNGYEKVVLLLLDPNLNPNMDVSVRTAKDETALHLAAREGHDLVVRVLLDADSDPSATTSDEVTVLGLAGRGENEGHQKAIEMISTALDPPKRKDALLDCYGLEDKTTLARLVEFLDWTGLEKPQVIEEGDLIWHAARKEKDNHDIVLQRLREKDNKKIQPVPLPPTFNKETLSALQYATYLGDWNIVWWLLYSGWSKEMERDRDGALKIAKWCENQLSGTGAKAMAMKEQKHDTKRTVMPESGLPAELAQSTNDKKGQDKKDKMSKTNEEKNKEVEKKKNDYPSIIDTLRDPPVRDADIVRGWSETDDLYQTPEIDKAAQQVIELFDGTIG